MEASEQRPNLANEIQGRPIAQPTPPIAAPNPTPPAPTSAVSAQATSDENLREMRARLSGLLLDLQAAQGSFGGHRASAVGHFQQAINDLGQALKFRADQDAAGQNQDDWALRAIANISTRIVASLQADESDYGGHRVDAIASLQAAVSDLNAAVPAMQT
jgi:hypothetical protein